MTNQLLNRLNLISSKYLGIKISYYARGGGWIMFGQIIDFIIGLTISVIFARLATQETYGQYQLILSLVTIVSIVSIPGLKTSVLRSVAQGFEGTYEKGTRLSFLWSLTGIPILILIAGYYLVVQNNNVIAASLLIATILFPFYYGPNTWSAYLQGKGDFRRDSLYSSIIAVVQLITIGLILLTQNNNVILIILADLASVGLLNLLFYFRLKGEITNHDQDPGWKKQGYSLSLLTFVANSYNYLDKIIVGTLMSLDQLAVYSIAVMITNKSRVLFKMSNRLLFPKLAKFDHSKMQTMIQQRLPLIMFGVIFFAIGLYLIIPTLITYLYSEKYAASIPYARFYLVSLPFAFLMTFYSHIFVALKLEQLLVKIQYASFVVNLVLYLTLIPLFGLNGAILSSLLYFLTFSVLAIILLNRSTPSEKLE